MKKILVPFDGSEGALRALEHAIRTARDTPSLAILLVHAHEESLGVGVTPDYLGPDRVAELLRAHAREVLAPAEARLAGSGVVHSTEILVGPVAETIAERANALGCAGIVMGARGVSPFKGLLLGSVSSKVIRLARVPVTIVK